MTFKLLGIRVAIEVLPGTLAPSPTGGKEFIMRGKILALGKEITEKKTSLLKEGQMILYITDWSHEIEVDGKVMTIINEEEIVAIVEGE